MATATATENQEVQTLEIRKEIQINAPIEIAFEAVLEGRLHKILRGTPNAVEHWKPLFDWASEPKADKSAYPPFEEVLQTFRRLREETLAFLDEVGESGLNRPPKLPPPPPLSLSFQTVGSAILVIACHQCFHTGEAAVARRASGKQPAFVPSEELRAF